MIRLRLPPPPRALAFLLAALPLAWLVAGIAGLPAADLGPNPVRELTHFTGKTALNLLGITLLISPLRSLSGDARWLRLRRMMGLWAFAYAAMHFTVYAVLELDLSWAELGKELVKRPYIWVGAAALLGLLPLAVTSTDRMMRRLGRRWQLLHRLVYAIAALAAWHYAWQVKADLREPLLYAAALAVLLGWRLRRWRARRAAAAHGPGAPLN